MSAVAAPHVQPVRTSDPAVEFFHVSMKFGDFSALNDISLRLEPHGFHVILGENGAGKSTLVKCLVGYQKATSGQIVVDGTETMYESPRDAHEDGLGMVYQSFTLADNLTVAEHFVLGRDHIPFLPRWKEERKHVEAFFSTMPFRLPLEARIADLSAGEKQKLEILMQLYQERKILILDEPSSVLTPSEADEVLGLLKARVQAKSLTVILITHKFRELLGYGDTVSVLRRGELVAHGPVSNYTPEELARQMIGESADSQANPAAAAPPSRAMPSKSTTILEIRDLSLIGPRGSPVLEQCTFAVKSGEIYGIAGVSGNGQKELVEVLTGLHSAACKFVTIHGKPFVPSYNGFREAGFNLIPELPLKNACVGSMSLWENIAFRSLEHNRAWQQNRARELKESYGIKAQSIFSPIRTLSGGNVQRAVLARELRDDTRLLVAANPCFGLDFKASAAVHQALRDAKNRGAAVLLVSEDLDEVLALADRIGVMFDGHIVFECPGADANVTLIGTHMAGHQQTGQERTA